MSTTKVMITVIATLTAIVGLAVVTGVAAIAALVMVGQGQYGQRMEYKNAEVYYTSEVTEEEAKRFVLYLISIHAGDKQRITFQLDRSGEDFVVRMCAQKYVYATEKADTQVQEMRDEIQATYFPTENVVFEACDDKLRPRKTWRAKGAPTVK